MMHDIVDKIAQITYVLGDLQTGTDFFAFLMVLPSTVIGAITRATEAKGMLA